MEPERNEVFERIPWETLEDKKPDRQWITLGVAGAIVLGALAYTWTSSRSTSVPTTAVVSVPASPAGSVVAPPAMPPAAPVTTALAPTPGLTAEADLYAVHPERAIDRATAHAEWFVAEYLTVDGSEESKATLGSLLPAGVPLPVAPEGTRVFVEWVRSMAVEEVANLTYRVTVLARTLAAAPGGEYVRQPPLRLDVDISVADATAQVLTAPRIAPAPSTTPSPIQLIEVPEEVAKTALEASGGTEIVGGVQDPVGGWQVIVMTTGAGEVSRPVTVPVPAA